MLNMCFRMAIDYRTVGFTYGVLALFLTPFVLKPLNLSVPKPLLSVTNGIMAVFFTFVPTSIVLILLNYLGYIPTTKPLAGVGPFLFIVSVASFIKFLLNWKHLSRSVQLLLAFEGAIFLAVLTVSIIGVEFANGRTFDIGFLVGSWAMVYQEPHTFAKAIALPCVKIATRFM